MAYQSDQFSWKHVNVAINGRNIADLLGISFSEKIESELIYGKGNKPISIQDGNIAYEGKVKVHRSEIDKILASTGNKGVEGMRGLTITLALVMDGKISQRTLVGARITELPENWAQNDKFAELELPFIFLDIIY